MGKNIKQKRIKIKAEELAQEQKQVSVSEFFLKNRHLLGFDNPIKALSTTVKELVDNSLTYDMPIMVKENGIIRLMKIGELVDKYIANTNKKIVLRDGHLEKTRVDNIEVLAFDKNLKMAYRPVSALFRHKVNSDIYKVSLEGGRSVELTKYHSVFRLEKGNIKSIKTSELKVGDPIIVPRNAWNSNCIKEIDLLDELMRLPEKLTKNICVYNVASVLKEFKSQIISLVPHKYRFFDFKKCDNIPLNILRKLSINPDKLRLCKLGYRQCRHKLPLKIQINDEFAYLLGIYLAEGSTLHNLHKLYFSFGHEEKELAQFTSYLVDNIFGIKPSICKAHDTALNVIVNSKSLAFIFKCIFKLGNGAGSKRVSSLIFNLSKDLRGKTLLAYLVGDGYPTKKIFKVLLRKGTLQEVPHEKLTAATKSHELFIGLQYLLSSIGLSYSTGKSAPQERMIKGIKAKFSESYYLYIYTKQDKSTINKIPIADACEQIGCSKLNYAFKKNLQTQVCLQTLLGNNRNVLFDSLDIFLKGDLGVLTIKDISKINYNKEWVYDVSVPECENFVAGNGAIVCHNSLDACEEMKVLPEIIIKIKNVGENRFTISVEDNGPGIVKKQIPNVFARLLYGSKFHSMKQGRGQQGIGVCMPPNTLIPLGDGKVLPVKEIVEKKLNADLFVLTPDLTLGLGKINKFWKIPSPPYLIDLKVLGGREIVLTPENPILTRTENGLKWKDAESVDVGDYMAISRKLASHIPKEKITIFDFLDDDTQIDNYDFTLKILYRLKKKYGTWKDVGQKFGLNKEQLKGWCKKNIRRRPTKKLLALFCSDLKISKQELIKNCRRVGKLGNYVDIPLYVNEDFMKFLGYIAGDGSSQPKRKDRWGRNCALWNNDAQLKKDFENIVWKLFKIKSTYIKHSKGRGEMVQFSSSLVARLINVFGIPSGKKFDKFKIIPLVHRKDLLRPFLRALYDCEGSVSLDRNNINFMIRNKEMTKYISLFLIQFGVMNRINKANNDIRLIISGEKNVKKFYNEIGFLHPEKNKCLKQILKANILNEKKSHMEKIPFLRKNLVSLKNHFNLSNKDFSHPYIFSRNNPISYPVLKSAYDVFMSKVKTKKMPLELQELHCLLNSDVIWVPITTKIKKDSREPFVYDLTMQQGNNFIADGVLVHNSASVLYGQLTTGKSTKIISRIDPKHPANFFELNINTVKNEPEIITDKEVEWMNKNHGTKVEIEIEGKYQKGKLSVDEYIRQSAISNPHARFTYISPLGEEILYKRATNELPKEPKKIKPHPYGVELGMLMRMLKDTKAKTLLQFFTKEFSRASSKVAKEICTKANIPENTKPKFINHSQADGIFKAIQQTKIMAPPTDCLSPIGEKLLLQSLKKEVDAEFFATATRSPSVYRGIPFQIEAAIAYGGSLSGDNLIRLMRFANKVPLQYQQSGCAVTRSAVGTLWKNYGLQQSKGALPTGAAAIIVNISSVWVPFTSESKEAIAHYPEIIKDIKLALQECGRQLGKYLSKRRRVADAEKKKSYIEKYIPHIGEALKDLLELKKVQEDKVVKILKEELEKQRKM